MIVYACADLIFATKVRSTAESLGIVTRPARDAEALQKRLDRVDDGSGKPNDPVSAVLIDLDTGDLGLALIDQTRRHDPAIPIVAFGAHVAVELLKSAEARGATVMPRGAFTARLPQLLQSLNSKA